jgi:hypothetical protein
VLLTLQRGTRLLVTRTTTDGEVVPVREGVVLGPCRDDASRVLVHWYAGAAGKERIQVVRASDAAMWLWR